MQTRFFTLFNHTSSLLTLLKEDGKTSVELRVLRGEHSKTPVSEGCKVAVAKCQSYAFRMEQKTQPATRNFFWLSFGVRVCVCVPYIYKIKIKKIIYYIELRYTRPLRVGKNTTSKSKAQPGCKLRSCNKVLWEILHDNGYYAPTLSNWNSQIR